MIVLAIVPYLLLGFYLSCIAEDERFCAWLIFWPIVIGVKAIKELIEICTR